VARILVVDDNPPNLALMQYLLAAFGHVVRAFDTSRPALDAALAGSYELILADVRMRDMDGFEFVRRYKAEAATPAPVVAVTALAMVGDKERMLEAGFDGYIAKPIDPETFKKQIDDALAHRVDDRPAILAVDDVAVNLDVLDHTLGPFGYRVIRASSVREAKQKLAGEVPMLIMCDIHMPESDGFELIEYVKNDERLRGIPLFVMSSTAWQTSEKQRALALGAAKFILRPIEPQALVNEVRSVLAR
jgi:two-component system, cell cycle response regulator